MLNSSEYFCQTVTHNLSSNFFFFYIWFISSMSQLDTAELWLL